MSEIIAKKPAFRQGWLRVLLFCLAFIIGVAIMAILGGLVILWIKRDEILNGKPADAKELMKGEFLWLSTLLGLVLSFLLVFFFRKWIDRKKMSDLGFQISGNVPDLLSGFFLAPALLGVGTLILFFSKHLEWTDVTLNSGGLFIDLGILLIVAFMEELVFRGYILGNLMDSFNRWVALALSAFLFAIFHIDSTGFNIIPITNIFLAGILLGINYTYTRNLWFAIMFHFSWNFFQGPLMGFRVSGIQFHNLLQNNLSGDITLTGGEFGFEGSVIDGALTFICILFLYWIFERKSAIALNPAISTATRQS